MRDSYPYPQEEAIVTELVANALDSGASAISVALDPYQAVLTMVDNGAGMTPRQLEKYHDIASTSKVRGKGIGFAGVGAKLALLVAEEVVTETLKSTHHRATIWKLESDGRAPWEYMRAPGLVRVPRGTAVAIHCRDQASELLSGEFIEQVIQRHYHPLLDQEFMAEILHRIYKRGVVFTLNGRHVFSSPNRRLSRSKVFLVKVGKRAKPIGIGFLGKSDEPLPEDERGIAISTYGKVIKRGWDWIGIAPRNPMRLSGLVELPDLSQILTLNKADFLRDATSLQKYYRYRKAIQDTLHPILKELGELHQEQQHTDRHLRTLENEIDRILRNLLTDFPELDPLFLRRRIGDPVAGTIFDPNDPPVGVPVIGLDMMTGTEGGSRQGQGIPATEGPPPGEHIEPGSVPSERGHKHEGRRRRPGIMIGFEDNYHGENLARMVGSTIWINTSHPAYKRSADTEAESYHIALAVVVELSHYLEAGKSPQRFVSQFLSHWGSRM